MPIRNQKPYLIAMKLFRELPESVKNELAMPESVEKISNIIGQAQISETVRSPLSNVIYGLFIGELPPRLLTDAIKEEMQLEDAKAQLVAALVRKAFVEPHIEFLTKLYQGTPKTNSQIPSVPQGNVVNLAKPKASL